MIPKIEILGLNFGRLRGPFGLFQGQKSRFLHFKSCFGVFQKLFGDPFRP